MRAAESKVDKKHELVLLNEMCEMRNCTKCVYFESKKRKDLYLWCVCSLTLAPTYAVRIRVSNVPRGPSVKFLVHNGIERCGFKGSF